MTWRTGVVLAGGRSRRFRERASRDKLSIKVGGETSLCRVVKALSEVSEEVIISLKEEGAEVVLEALKECETDVKLVFDPGFLKIEGPMIGIFSSSSLARGNVLVSSGDRPFLKPRLLERLYSEIERGSEVCTIVGPRGKVDPSLAAFDSNYLRLSSSLLILLKRVKLTNLLRGASRISLLSPLKLEEEGCDLRGLINVNSPDDLAKDFSPSRAPEEDLNFSIKGGVQEALREFHALVSERGWSSSSLEHPFWRGTVSLYFGAKLPELSTIAAEAFLEESEIYSELGLEYLKLQSLLDRLEALDVDEEKEKLREKLRNIKSLE